MNTERAPFATYHKIQSIYKRDMDSKDKKLIIGEYSCPEFEYLRNNDWEFTEKVDGTNVRVLWDGENFKFGGRTDKADMPQPLLDVLDSMFNKKRFITTFGKTIVTVYGEGYGGKIQAGGKYNPTQTFVVFDMLINGWWMTSDGLRELCKALRLLAAPIRGQGTLDSAISWVTTGIISKYGCFEAEGLVARPMLELKARNGSRIITKIKGKDF